MNLTRSGVSQEIRARVVADKFVASLLVWNWQQPVIDFQSGYHSTMLSMALSPLPADAKASLARCGSGRSYGPVGDIMLLRPGETIHTVSGQGQLVALQCIFNDLDFGPWNDEQWRASLDIGSAAIRQTCERLSIELKHPGFAGELAIDALCRLLKADLHRYFSGLPMAASSRSGGLAHWRLNRIDERITANGPPPTLAELATLCGLSERHLSRAFRQSRGEALAGYAARVRMEQAKQRLRSSSLPISQIAADLGFATPAAFSYAFRAAVGTTPRDFRDPK